MFTKEDIDRAHRIVKVATAGTPPVGTQLDPYSYSNYDFGSKVNQDIPKGFEAESPGFWGSAGRSLAGVAMKPFDFARSAIGAAPGRGMFGNKILGGYGGLVGAKLFKDPQWEAESRAHIKDPMGWVGPYSRAMEQSDRYAGALPQYLSKHAPFFVHPIQTTHEFLRGRYSSPYPWG